MHREQISLFLNGLLLFGFVLMALPDQGFAGVGPIGIDCCQREGSCIDTTDEQFICLADEVIEDAFCDDSIGLCIPTGSTADNIPTLSEWGLIAMAGIIGIAGFIVIRRRKASA